MADAIIAAAAAAAAKVGYKPPHWNCTSEFLQKMEANVCISPGLHSISHISRSFFYGVVSGWLGFSHVGANSDGGQEVELESESMEETV